jgi:hypothetical protein
LGAPQNRRQEGQGGAHERRAPKLQNAGDVEKRQIDEAFASLELILGSNSGGALEEDFSTR